MLSTREKHNFYLGNSFGGIHRLGITIVVRSLKISFVFLGNELFIQYSFVDSAAKIKEQKIS